MSLTSWSLFDVVCPNERRTKPTRLRFSRPCPSGRPVIASDVGGVREVVGEGETGLVFAPHDLDGFVARLKMLASGSSTGSALGRAAGSGMIESSRSQGWLQRLHCSLPFRARPVGGQE